MSISEDDIELDEIQVVPDVTDAQPLMAEIRPINETAVELRYNPPDDPIYHELSRGYKNYLQWLIERLILYDKEDQLKGALSHLRREILLSDSETLDAEGEGGISTFFVREKLNDAQKIEYEQKMCLFERLLWILVRIPFKDNQPTDVVELMLVKSNKIYKEYKNERVLSLLREYDKLEPSSVKYLQYQIFSGVAEDFVENHQKNANSRLSLESINSEISETNTEETNFWSTLGSALTNEDHLDEIFEAVFSAGSLELLKYLLTEINRKNISLKCPVLVNAVYWSMYVKEGNLQKFRDCFNVALESEKSNLGDTDPSYGDTALHFANDLRENFMIRDILRKYPPIAVKNKKGKFPISNITKDDFKNFLDSLLTDIPKVFLTNLDVWKIIKGIYIGEYGLKNVIFVNYNTFISTKRGENKKEFHDLELIREIKDSNELWELVDHPVISVLLELHWNQLKWSIILDQYLCLFVTLVIFFVIIGVDDFLELDENFNFFNKILVIISSVSIILELINNRVVFIKIFKFLRKICRKMIKFVKKSLNERKKVKNVPHVDEVDANEEYNYEENEGEIVEESQKKHRIRFYGTIFSFALTLPLLILIFLYGFWECTHETENCKTLFGIGMIILSLNISLFIGYFCRYIAINLIMLFYVASTGIKFIFSTFLILLGFAFSLTTLIKNYGLPENDENKYTLQECKQIFIDKDAKNNSDDALSTGSILGLAIFKTIIMSTGEYEAGGLEFPFFTSYLVFICFVFTIPIVFINLLNALAIEDVQKIKKEAMIWYRKVQIMFLYEFKILHKSIFSFCFGKSVRKEIFPDVIGEKAFVGLRTTTREILKLNDLNKHETIGYLPLDVIENAERELKNTKNI